MGGLVPLPDSVLGWVAVEGQRFRGEFSARGWFPSQGHLEVEAVAMELEEYKGGGTSQVEVSELTRCVLDGHRFVTALYGIL